MLTKNVLDFSSPYFFFLFSEAKVFACFVKLMDKMEHNFPHGTLMDGHLSNINSLIQVKDYSRIQE